MVRLGRERAMASAAKVEMATPRKSSSSDVDYSNGPVKHLLSTSDATSESGRMHRRASNGAIMNWPIGAVVVDAAAGVVVRDDVYL